MKANASNNREDKENTAANTELCHEGCHTLLYNTDTQRGNSGVKFTKTSLFYKLCTKEHDKHCTPLKLKCDQYTKSQLYMTKLF